MRLNKREEQIFSKISNILLKGNGFRNEYIEYINKVINDNEYNVLVNVFEKILNIDASKISLNEMESESFVSKILFNINSDELVIIKKILDKNNLYQVSNIIYKNIDNSIFFKYVENDNSIIFTLYNTNYSLTLNKTDNKVQYIWNFVIKDFLNY